MKYIVEHIVIILFSLLLLLYFIYFYASIKKFNMTNIVYLLLLIVLLIMSIIYIYMYFNDREANKNFIIIFPIFAFFILYLTFDITVSSPKYKHMLLVLVVSEFMLLIILELLFYQDRNKIECKTSETNN